jgi:hypothetical protein
MLEASAFDFGFVPVLGQLLELAARLLGGAGFELCVDIVLLFESSGSRPASTSVRLARAALRASASSMSG